MRLLQTKELENLITWMEENHERLRARPADWINKAKEDVFPDNGHITAGKVRGE